MFQEEEILPPSNEYFKVVERFQLKIQEDDQMYDGLTLAEADRIKT